MPARTINTENGHISVGKVQASSNEPAERSFFRGDRNLPAVTYKDVEGCETPVRTGKNIRITG
jgi:hypothetical protein